MARKPDRFWTLVLRVWLEDGDGERSVRARFIGTEGLGPPDPCMPEYAAGVDDIVGVVRDGLVRFAAREAGAPPP